MLVDMLVGLAMLTLTMATHHGHDRAAAASPPRDVQLHQDVVWVVSPTESPAVSAVIGNPRSHSQPNQGGRPDGAYYGKNRMTTTTADLAADWSVCHAARRRCRRQRQRALRPGMHARTTPSSAQAAPSASPLLPTPRV